MPANSFSYWGFRVANGGTVELYDLRYECLMNIYVFNLLLNIGNIRYSMWTDFEERNVFLC